MIDRDLLTAENLKFVKQFSEDFNFCTPIKSISGNIYYPITHEKLFLRYYISFTGDIYDNVTGEFKYHQIEDYDKFIATDTNEELILSIKDLVWRTYYRFPKARAKIIIDECRHAHKIVDHTDDIHEYYVIDGVEFASVKFPKDSLLCEEFIENDKCQLIVSKDGAVFNIKKHQFLKVIMDSSGQLYYGSKSGRTFKLQDFIIYGWYNKDYDPREIEISSISQHAIFSNYNNLILSHKDKYLHDVVGISNIVQHCGCAFSKSNMDRYHQNYNKHLMLEYKDKKYDQYEIDKNFGKLYNIPIEGMQNYRLIKCGIIYSITKKKILTPINFVGKRNDVSDITYFIPELKREILISELIMWTFYRLTRSSIAKLHCRILFNTDYNVPYIDDVILICKSHTSTEASYIIGSELFLKSLKSPNLYFSKNGAIYDSDSASFILITGYIDNDGSYLVSAPSLNRNRLIPMHYELYRIWIGHVDKGLFVTTKNKIISDTTISNIEVIMNPNAPYIKKCYADVQLKMFNKIKELRLKKEKKLLKFYNVEKIEDIPKPYL